MNEGLKGEGKEVISNVENKENNLADNLTKFYSNEELVKNNKSTKIFSGETTLEQKENSTLEKFNNIEGPTTNESNPIYDFVAGLKDNIKNFINFKSIDTEEEYNKRMDASRSITLLVLFISASEFIFSHGDKLLNILINVLPVILLVSTYYLFRKHDKKAILLGILSSVFMIATLKVLNIIFAVFYLIGIILLLRYKKKTP